MHKHLSTPSPDGRPSLLDNISDSLVNAFTKVRKPDERFIEMRESIDKYEEAMNGIDRLIAKERSRTEGIFVLRHAVHDEQIHQAYIVSP